MSGRYLLNGAYSKSCPDDLIERVAPNGCRGVMFDAPAISLEKIPEDPYKDRVLDAISMLKEGFGQVDVQDKHGRIVYRQAKRLL